MATETEGNDLTLVEMFAVLGFILFLVFVWLALERYLCWAYGSPFCFI
jgi:hypothetical protein